MKPDTASTSFKLSLICFGAFIAQLIATRAYVQHVVTSNQSTILIEPLYWVGVLWISLGSTFYYRATKNKQTPLRQLLVFVVSPLVFAPLIGVLYAIVVLFPLYNLVGQHSFGH